MTPEMTPDLLRQKLTDQVTPRMRREGMGQWLVLTREGARDPLADLFAGGAAVGRMAIAITPDEGGVSLRAVCASYDTAALEESGLYAGVEAYGTEGWAAGLTDLLHPGAQGRIAVDCSVDEPHADGLSHTLREELARLAGRDTTLVSSEPLVVELLGRKTDAEVERIRRAAREAEAILRAVLRRGDIVPDRTTEREVAERIRHEVAARGYGFAWEPEQCPAVQFRTTRGHAPPGDRTVGRGELVAVDFGVEIDGYVSDLQRTLVMASADTIPDPIRKLWATTRASVDAAAAVMRPGASGLAVDTAARSVVRDAGYVDYIHATGHPLGYVVHDVGPMLGPDWPGRYGNRVHAVLEEGMVFTLEPAAAIETPDGLVRIGLEEDVVVRGDGVEYLAPPQTELWTLD